MRRVVRHLGIVTFSLAVLAGVGSEHGTAVRAEDEGSITGRFTLEGKQDDEPIETELTVARTGDSYAVIRVTKSRTGSTTYNGTGELDEGASTLRVSLATGGSIVGRIGAAAPEERATVRGTYSLKGRKLHGTLDATGAPWRRATEKGRIAAGEHAEPRGAERHGAMTRGPYLQATTSDSTMILWQTRDASRSSVEYGTTAALGSAAGTDEGGLSLPGSTTHEATLKGLTPGGTYYYRVVDGSTPLTSTQSFKTAAPPGASFRFLAFGDSGTGSTAQMDVARKLAGEDVAFAVHTGDVVYDGGDARKFDERFFAPYGSWLGTRCLYATIGNHDASSHSEYGHVFRGPRGSLDDRSYVFDWGDARFVCVDTSAVDQMSTPTSWLEGVLAGNTRKWLVVFTHVPPYSSSRHGSNTHIQHGVSALAERYGVDLVLNGHEHSYERTTPIHGTTYVITGGGGADLYGVDAQRFSAAAASAHHYVVFSLDGGTLSGRAVAVDGRTIDSFSLTARR
jgi:hypothetical protein